MRTRNVFGLPCSSSETMTPSSTPSSRICRGICDGQSRHDSRGEYQRLGDTHTRRANVQIVGGRKTAAVPFGGWHLASPERVTIPATAHTAADVEKTVTALRRSAFVLVAAQADCPAQLKQLAELQKSRSELVRTSRGRKSTSK